MLNWGPDGVLEKAGYNPDEPRDQRGRWTNDGDATVEANVAGRDPRTQLADLGISDASDDPIADAARTAARIDSDHKTSDGDDAPNMVLAAAESEDEKEPRSANELIPQRLQRSPAGPAVEFLDNLLDISGPGDEANLEMGQLLMDNLLHEIRKIDPNYVDSAIWPPGELAGMTWQERQNVISRFQAVLAAKIYGARGDIRPLQEVTLDFMQRATNAAYDEAVKRYEAGRLKVRLSREEAIGNCMDGIVRLQLRRFYVELGTPTDSGSAIRVNARAYNSSGADVTYRIPDARVGNFVFEDSLTAKTSSSAQIRGFFAADFAPIGVVIVRPNQLGNNSSYIIWRPKRW